MLVHIKDSQKTFISITNYSVYQNKKESSDMSQDTKSDMSTDTNNNVYNNNIIIFINKYKGTPKNFGESLKIVRTAREDSEWENFTPDQQLAITNKLMEVAK